MQSRLILIEKLIPYAHNPYKVTENEELEALRNSIRRNGILTPLTVRSLENGNFEVLSGHRRLAAARSLALAELPVFIVEADDDEAAIAVADGNLHRENLLPSEKAFAYKMKLEAIRHQGSCRGDTKRSDELLASEYGENARKIQRYIRLTALIPELSQLCDSGRIAVSVGAELSFIREEFQQTIYEFCCSEDCTPSYSQAWQMHRLDSNGLLTEDAIVQLLGTPKPNQRERVTIPLAELTPLLPDGADSTQAKKYILEACRHYHDYLKKGDN